MKIVEDDLSGNEIAELLSEHLDQMHSQSPPESIHAMGLQALQGSDAVFWSAWLEKDLAGCGALKPINQCHGEIKSMRTKLVHQRRGVARKMVQHIIDYATEQGMCQLSLETGSNEPFNAARKLYLSMGFHYCEPFGEYSDDPNSVFMTIDLANKTYQ